MKPTEIRIGNLISYNDCNLVADTISTRTGDNAILIDSKFYPYNVNLKECNGIKLLEFWILRFGFKKQKTISGNLYTIKLKKSFFSIYLKDDNHYCIENDNHGVKIQYVHQLQNIFFSLTNYELELEK